MDFELNQTDIARRFVAAVEQANGDAHALRLNWGLDIDQRRRPFILKELNQTLQYYNSLVEDPLPYPVPVDFDQEFLNRLHELFETRFMKQRKQNASSISGAAASEHVGGADSRVAKLLLSINQNIHTLESLLTLGHGNNGRQLTAWFSASLVNKHGVPTKHPLSADDYRLFTLEETFGALYLSYAATGKNLHQLYLRNDISLLERGRKAISQRSMSAGAIALFGTVEKTHEQEMKRFHQWWDENDLSRFGYRKNDPGNALGYIPIGKLAPTANAKPFFDKRTGRFDELALVCFYSDYFHAERMAIV